MPLKMRELGSTGIRVSEIGLGAWAIGGNSFGNSYGPTDDAESIRAVRRAFDMGCNLFDTADAYGHGHSEEILGEALSGRRGDCIIATKVGGDFYTGYVRSNFDPRYIRFAFERSLERLRTDYIDIYQLHNPSIEQIREGGVFEVMKELKSEGRIRVVGLSIHDPQEGILAIEKKQTDIIQVVHNIFSTSAADELLPMARRTRTAILAREPLANGFLTGRYNSKSIFPAGDIRHYWPREYIAGRVAAAESLRPLVREGRTMAQLAIQFAISHDAVSSTIPGAKTVRQVEENLAASSGPPLTKEELLLIERLRGRGFRRE